MHLAPSEISLATSEMTVNLFTAVGLQQKWASRIQTLLVAAVKKIYEIFEKHTTQLWKNMSTKTQMARHNYIKLYIVVEDFSGYTFCNILEIKHGLTIVCTWHFPLPLLPYWNVGV